MAKDMPCHATCLTPAVFSEAFPKTPVLCMYVCRKRQPLFALLSKCTNTSQVPKCCQNSNLHLVSSDRSVILPCVTPSCRDFVV